MWRHSRGGVFKSADAKAYEWAVLAVVREQALPLLQGELRVSLVLYRPEKRGDVDNYAKTLLDSLQGHVYANDRQICELHIVRRDDRHNPRVEVEISEVEGHAE